MFSSYSKFAGFYGILAGVSGLLYLVLFIALKNPSAMLPALFLMLLGLFASATIVALYQRVREVDEGFALWGLLLGVAGAGGAAVHGAFDLANSLNPPKTTLDIAFPADPRGFLTFAVAGIAAFVISWLILRGGVFSRGVAYLGLVSGVLLVLLYVTYLVILNATNPIVLALIFASRILQPVWYLWIGWLLWQGGGEAKRR